MKKFVKLILLSAILVPCASYGQNSFKPGYIITNDNTEIKGFVDAKGWKQDPLTVYFRETDTSTVLKLHPADIKAFKIEENYFVSAQVDIEISPSGVDELLISQYTPDALHIRAYNEANRVSTEKIVPEGEVKYQRGDSVMVLAPQNINASVFLQVLVTGNLNLFYFRATSGKDHFYLSSTPGNYEELFRIFYANETQAVQLIVFEVEFFKTTLLKYMAGVASFEEKILRMNFTKKNFIDIFILYNSMTGSAATVYFSDEEKWVYKFGPLVAAGVAGMDFMSGMSGHKELGIIDFGYDPSFMVGGQIDIIFPGAGERFSLYNELAGRWNKFDGDGVKTDPVYDPVYYSSSFDMYYLRLAHMVRFRLATGSVNPFIGAGLSYSFILHNENQITTTTDGTPETKPALNDPKKNEQAFCAGTGLIIENLSLEARYELGNNYSKYFSLSGVTNTFYLIASYLF